MFYSITNCQEGLRGISFGNQLIKQVAEDLKREFPHLRRFATLSPSRASAPGWTRPGRASCSRTSSTRPGTWATCRRR